MLPKMLRSVWALLVCVALATLPALAQNKVFPFPYQQEDLPNGLRLITIPTDAPNLVSVYIVMQTGSRNEVEPGKTGFAHLFEHMMFRGTEKFPAERYGKVLQEIGASSNASTSRDWTIYHTTFSKEDLGQVMEMEADRFQNLKYSEEVFRTEAGAVLGEYNKNATNPDRKINEVLSDTAYVRNTYKHTTMGFLDDIKDMPNQFDYSLKFFDRYYRPEYATLIVTGDIEAKQVRALTDKYWGGWKHGSYHPDIPVEPPQEVAKETNIDWPLPAEPEITIAFHMPAYSDTDKAWSALSALGRLEFSQNSELYQRLVVTEQRLTSLSGGADRSVDAGLFEISAQVKKVEDLDYAREQILAAIKRLQTELVDAKKLEIEKKRSFYQFPMRLDDSDAVASAVAQYVALKRTPDTIDKSFALFSELKPEDLRDAARKYLVESNRTIVTLKGPAERKAGGAK